MIQERDDVVALDSAIIQHPRTWEASGHLAGFTDPLVQCLGKCKQRFREDHLREAQPGGRARLPGVRRRAERAARVQPDVRDDDRPGEGRGLDGLPAARDRAGHLPRLQDDAPVRAPQAAVRHRAGRQVVPQRDHARQLHLPHARVRADGDGVLRAARPRPGSGTSTGCRSGWTGTSRLGIDRERLRLRAHDADELSHYSSATADIEYLYPIGWSELEGIANRGDFDLTQHAEFSGEKLEYFDPETRERYIPHVIEPAAGVGRTMLALLCDAYDEDEIGGEKRTVLRLHPSVAPVKVAVLPLLRKDGHPEHAREIYEELRRHVSAEYDSGGHIGKRYRRQDEIGTPLAVTIDHQTLEDDTVTLRERDTLTQDRVPVGELVRV